MKIVMFGNITYDHIIHLNEFPSNKPHSLFATDEYVTIGGSGAGKAFNMNRLGIEFLLGTRFALDEGGLKIKELLKEEGINYFFDEDPVSTVRHTNLMDSHGDRISIFTNNGSSEEIIDLEKYKKPIKEADVIILNISNFCKEYIPLIKESNAKVWTDLHDYDGLNEYHQDFIDVADVVFISVDKIRSNYNEVVEELKKNSELLVCTKGSSGAEAFFEGDTYNVKASKNKQVDTNGAGDGFFSGFFWGYLNKYSVKECLELGAVVGGLCVESKMLFNENLTKETLIELHKKNTS